MYYYNRVFFNKGIANFFNKSLCTVRELFDAHFYCMPTKSWLQVVKEEAMPFVPVMFIKYLNAPMRREIKRLIRTALKDIIRN